MTFTYHIGFDLDNTIVSYDASFHSIGVSQSLIPDTLPANKSTIRNYLIANNRHCDFVFLQSLVYGLYIDKAKLFDDFLNLFHYLTSKYSVCIISHKTLFPNSGPQVNLHDASIDFLRIASLFSPNFQKSSIYFCNSQESKLECINNMVSNLFFDDLPSILDSITVPQPVLFDPMRIHSVTQYPSVSSWSSVRSRFDL